MKIIVFIIIAILFILFLSVFAYIYILTESMNEYYNESNFRRKEKDYKENNSFIEGIEKPDKNDFCLVKLKRKKRKNKVLGGIKKQRYFRKDQKSFVTSLKDNNYFKNEEND